MEMIELESFYEAALRPVFGSRLRVFHERDDLAHIVLDGDEEDFFFTLYGTDHARLYWCNECFIFDRRRNQLVSSDTYGEIVYEDMVEAETLPAMIVDLALRLKDCVFLYKEERVRGKTPSGYDEVRDYVVHAAAETPPRPCRLGNILLVFHQAGEA